MANENNKIPCGGFYLGDGLTMDGNTLKSSGGGASVQSDWNQNDDTQPDYVKNRTHYEEKAYVDYVLNLSSTRITGFSMPEVGETMTVKINGVDCKRS